MLEEDQVNDCRPHYSIAELFLTKLYMRTLENLKNDHSSQKLDSFKWHHKKSFIKLKPARENETIISSFTEYLNLEKK